jgi:peptidoglycan hydrolase CwlO-like protein
MNITITPERLALYVSLVFNIIGSAYSVRAGILQKVAEENARLAATRGEAIADLSREIKELEKRIDHLEQIIADKDRKIDRLLGLRGERASDKFEDGGRD